MIKSRVKRKEADDENIRAYTWAEFEPPTLIFHEMQRNHKIYKYATTFMCLDTETSHDSLVRGWVYQWAIKFDNAYIYGRSPDEIVSLLEKLCEYYGLRHDKRILIYIHNASYDLQYLKAFLFEYDPKAHFLALDNHSILICDVMGFRIICSYKLTNLSLAALSDKYAKEYIKAVGEIDYTNVHYQDEELSATDWYYMFSDVASQYDGVTAYLNTMGYKYAYNAPYTSTGFVRTECRTAANNADYWHDEFIESQLPYQYYLWCRQCFMGGVTIQSFKYAGVTIRSDKLRHLDFTSSYPARQKINYFPTGAPSYYGNVEDFDEFNEMLETYCCIFTLTLEDVHINPNIFAPCIPSSKCIHIEGETKINGKVTSADKLSIIVCELDYKWIEKQYTAESMTVTNLIYFERGKMPEWLTDEVMHFFTNKCTLKEVDELLYAKSKAYLNSIYGMTATAPVREVFEMNRNHVIEKKKYEDKNERQEREAAALSKYYNSYNNYMPYQYAIYTTAHARDALYTMIEATGDGEGHEYDNFIYCDTDSVFYLETETNKKTMPEYIAKCKAAAVDAGAFVGENFLGMPTEEPKIRAFRGLHAKCYAMEEWDKKKQEFVLKVTIAGIPKVATKFVNGKPVTKTNAEELGSIDNLKDGFVFKHCGGIRCIYNEAPITTTIINGHKITYASSAILENIEKKISEQMWTTDDACNVLEITQEEV